MIRRSWSAVENEALIADYFSMLKAELRNEKINKASHLRALKPKLDGRTDRAIEDKHQNVSAILQALRCPSIDGYKPLRNFQLSLFDAVEERYLSDTELSGLLAERVPGSDFAPVAGDLLACRVSPPHSPRPPNRRAAERIDKIVAKVDWIDVDARNRKLGLAGELFVLEYERQRLTSEGFGRLAARVEHASVTTGDGLGFDVRSFDTHGEELFIEVKTTSYSRDTPFYLTKNELRLSQNLSKSFRLYRVFQFYREPRFFDVAGPLDKSCLLDPVVFSGTVK